MHLGMNLRTHLWCFLCIIMHRVVQINLKHFHAVNHEYGRWIDICVRRLTRHILFIFCWRLGGVLLQTDICTTWWATWFSMVRIFGRACHDHKLQFFVSWSFTPLLIEMGVHVSCALMKMLHWITSYAKYTNTNYHIWQRFENIYFCCRLALKSWLLSTFLIWFQERI